MHATRTPSARPPRPRAECMTSRPDVDEWFAQLEHPLKPLMQRLRKTILAADPRIAEIVKYGTVQFSCIKDMCSFVQVKDPRRVSLMFNAAGRLMGAYEHLEGKSVKY